MNFSFLTAASFAVVLVAPAVNAQVDPACPDGTLASAPFNMPNDGLACLLCSQIMETCGLKCSSAGVNAPVTCTTDPEDCGVIVCPDGPSAPTTTPPAPTPPAVPAPTPPTSEPVEPPADVGTPEQCGVEVATGCVLSETAETDSPVDCNEYVPSSPAECGREVRYTYLANQTAPPLDVIYGGAYRYRYGSHWEAQHGNPRVYYEDRIGWNITPTAASFLAITQWEGEFVDFCAASSSQDTTFQFTTNGGDSGSKCRISDTYSLITSDVPFAVPATPMDAEEVVPAEGMAGIELSVAATAMAADDVMDDGTDMEGAKANAGTLGDTSPAFILQSSFVALATGTISVALTIV